MFYFSNWWPMFVLIFYFLSPVPTVISRRMSDSLDTASSACVELAIFLTTGIVISAVGLPVVLAHVTVVSTLDIFSVLLVLSKSECIILFNWSFL